MIISINGTLVNVERIFKITPIKVDRTFECLTFKFWIHGFDSEPLEIQLDTEIYFRQGLAFRDELNEYFIPTISDGIQKTDKSFEQIVETSSVYQEKMKKITDFREQIIQIWQQTPKTIQHFEL